MTVRRSHGSARPEVARPDELPVGRPAPPRPAPARDAQGRFRPGAGTTEVARRAAQARHAGDRMARRMAAQLGLDQVGPELAPYIRAGQSVRDAVAGDLAQHVGGGVLSPAVATMVEAAALAHAASRVLYARASHSGDRADLAEARAQAIAARQHLIAARELAARDARERVASGPQPWLATARPWVEHEDDDR